MTRQLAAFVAVICASLVAGCAGDVWQPMDDAMNTSEQAQTYDALSEAVDSAVNRNDGVRPTGIAPQAREIEGRLGYKSR